MRQARVAFRQKYAACATLDHQTGINSGRATRLWLFSCLVHVFIHPFSLHGWFSVFLSKPWVCFGLSLSPIFIFSFFFLLIYILYLFFTLHISFPIYFWSLVPRLTEAHSSRRTIPLGLTAVTGISHSFIFKVITFSRFQYEIQFLSSLN